jgi:predicted anti-sigma-YlaC factor YlaD
MNCREVIGQLLDLLDGELSDQAEQAIREHLEECEKCRTEHQKLRAAHSAVRVAAHDIAPRRTYRTPERVERLMGAVEKQKRKRRITRIYRTAVATAALLTIAICGTLIVDDLMEMTAPAETTGEEPKIAQQAPVQLMLASGGQRRGITAVRPVKHAGTEPSPPQQRLQQVARLDTPGVEVPVDHAFYDAEESARWW